jgi:ankyrin repeat protein
VIDLLLGHGADINAVDYRGNSMVDGSWCACEPEEVVPALLERGLNPNLALPIVEGEPVRGRAELLLKAGADPKRIGGRVLQWATATGDVDLARWALGFGPDLHNRRLTTDVLQWASKTSSAVPVLQMLADAGMDLDAAYVDGETGMTPLQYAVWMYPVGTVPDTSPGTLVEAGVTPDIFSAAGWNQVDRLRALIEGGADPNVRHATDGRTPLHWAARKDACDAAELLLRSGSSPNIQDQDGKLPFHAAYETRWNQPSQRILEMLLDAGTDLTLRDKNGTNVLGCLARGGGLSRPSLGWRLFEQGATM